MDRETEGGRTRLRDGWRDRRRDRGREDTIEEGTDGEIFLRDRRRDR